MTTLESLCTKPSKVAEIFGATHLPDADTLAIGGLSPLSTVDWPGKLVATVFTQGCPWSCGYCHNPALADPRAPSAVRWASVLDLLQRRIGQLDGVVFSGGEPTRQAALLPAMKEAKALGYGIGMHSAGAYPKRLCATFDYLDWLGLDIKALPEDYAAVVGRPGAGAHAWAALDAAVAWGGPLEVRLTVDPTVHRRDDVMEIVRRVKERGGPTPVLQEARPEGASNTYQRLLRGRRLGDVVPQADLLGMLVRA